MKFAGIIKTSCVDYPKKIVSTIFVQGCNLRCTYCHNPDLLTIKEGLIEENNIINTLKERYFRGLIDGVCITGGEPSLFKKELLPFIGKLKYVLGNEFLIKVDTNGTDSDFISDCNLHLVDYIAMDYKTTDYKNNLGIEDETIFKSLLEVKKWFPEDHQIRLTDYKPYWNKVSYMEDILNEMGFNTVVQKCVLKNVSVDEIEL